MTTAQKKDALRQRIRTGRAKMSADEWREADARRTEVVLELLQQRRTGCLAAYASRPGEPSTTEIIEGAHAAGWSILLPVIGRHVAWAEYTGADDMTIGPGGIPQPSSPPMGAGALARATLILVPALAVGSDGSRLGSGGGWYDQALPQKKSGTAVWALTRAVEVMPQVPTASHDVAVGAVITEAGFRALDASHGG